MKRQVFRGLGVAILAAGVLVRLHNAWAASVLAGYDAFGHFTYIWYVAVTHRLPMPTDGWSFFHPPLYYAFMAALWDALPGLDPGVRLKLGKLAISALGCVHSLVAWHVVARRFPADRRVRVMAAALPLVVPVQVYTAGFLGNESLQAVWSSVAIAALLRVLDRPSTGRAAVLGLVLGLLMLTKFTGIVVVAGALATIALKGVVQRRVPGFARAFATTAALTLVVCGGYYARNVAAYGSPFQLSRGSFLVSYVEDNQPHAERGWAEYLTFDPLIFRRPVWPRGSSGVEEHEPYSFERSVRESVWTGLYANTWFDGFGGWVLPKVTESEGARRSGQALLTLGLVPTLLMLAGAWIAMRDLRRRGWDDTVVSLALVSGAMLVLFVYGTREAPIPAAVKATYLTPMLVGFAFWFACGLAALAERRPRWTTAVDALCATQAVLCLAVFCQGLFFDASTLGLRMPRFDDAMTMQQGIVEYAGGNVAAARRDFEQAAVTNYHLAFENLAFLAIDGGRPREGLRLLRRAAALQREQLDGGAIGRERFLALSEAEYDHSIAVVLHGLGREGKAEALWRRALALDPDHAEARYCLALSRLEAGLASGAASGERREALDAAERELERVRATDPGLKEAWQLSVAVEVLRGDCDAARAVAAAWRALPWWTERRYPAATGTGAFLSASIGRRRLIAPRLAELAPAAAGAGCRVNVE